MGFFDTSETTIGEASETEYPEKVHGFRFDGIRKNGTIGFYGAPESEGPRIGNRLPRNYKKWTPAAFCALTEHVSPSRGCLCGWFVTEKIEELIEYQTHGFGLDVSATTVDVIENRPVITEVIGHGPKRRAGRNDPASAVRVTWVSLYRRVWIRDDIPDRTVRRTKSHWPFLRIERFGDLSELPGLVERSNRAGGVKLSQNREWMPVVRNMGPSFLR